MLSSRKGLEFLFVMRKKQMCPGYSNTQTVCEQHMAPE